MKLNEEKIIRKLYHSEHTVNSPIHFTTQMYLGTATKDYNSVEVVDFERVFDMVDLTEYSFLRNINIGRLFIDIILDSVYFTPSLPPVFDEILYRIRTSMWEKLYNVGYEETPISDDFKPTVERVYHVVKNIINGAGLSSFIILGWGDDYNLFMADDQPF